MDERHGWIFLLVAGAVIAAFIAWARRHVTPPTPQNLAQGTLGTLDDQALKQLQVTVTHSRIVETWPSLHLEDVLITVMMHNPTLTPVAIPLLNAVTVQNHTANPEYTNPTGQFDMLPTSVNTSTGSIIEWGGLTTQQLDLLTPSLWPTPPTTTSSLNPVLRIPPGGTVSGKALAPIGEGWHTALIDVLSSQTGQPTMMNIAVFSVAQ
ncbi:hypothetical protein [Sulfobacillus thermosulfidooxidans]|nr:hypothetical protein [Sulfobacillus thermosulfidooxidans]